MANNVLLMPCGLVFKETASHTTSEIHTAALLLRAAFVQKFTIVTDSCEEFIPCVLIVLKLNKQSCSGLCWLLAAQMLGNGRPYGERNLLYIRLRR